MKPQNAGEQPLIVVARVVKTKGLKGELVADLLTDFPERFQEGSRLYATSPDGERTEVHLEGCSFQQGRLVLKLVDFDTIESAATLIGCELALPEAERVQLSEDEFYDYELEGCAVELLSGAHLGNVTGVMRTGGVSILVVRNDQQRETLVPLAGAIVIDIDLEDKRIRIDPPEGLLEL
ncbi:MAG TPA: ribosome maturation factor RimM [Pyrinomonadaceae bacterium]|nr:ribosome maturation factor RimM [Pyrinomonadaceae bacterium]